MDLAWFLLILPFASAAVIQLRLKTNPDAAALVSVGSAGATLLITLILLAGETANVSFAWIDVPKFTIQVGLQLDALAKNMMLVVTGVGFLVHVFSLGYMKRDAAKARYFAGLSFFMFSMSGIVLADNFVMMFIFWELVGFSSYLLIGHWFRKDSAAEAAKKAFLVNRIGDFGFMIGILMLWSIAGHQLVFDEMKLPAGVDDTLLGAAILLIFCGAVGKSAQFPLHVWLPDAMEGPTPVSALIHAATMVAAGVYMLFRVQVTLGTEAFAGLAGHTIAWIGAITSLLAALMAIQQDDIKRILAYSTLSQLGYMVMAIGLAGHVANGDPNLPGQAAMFHLFSHAWFKALLFLGAGAVIFACHHEQDIWHMGGLFNRMRRTAVTFAAGTAALIAVPLTAGFFSKEQILEAALKHNFLLFLVAAFVAVLTAFYMTRLFVVAFLGESRQRGAREATEVPLVMLVPLVVLAVASLLAGWPWLAQFAPGYKDLKFHLGPVTLVSLAALATGVTLGWKLYKNRDRDPLRYVPAFILFRRKFYFDEIYQRIVRFGQDLVASVVHFFDEFLINGLIVGGIARAAASLGDVFRRLQTGNLQGYAILFGAGILLVIYLTVFVR